MRKILSTILIAAFTTSNLTILDLLQSNSPAMAATGNLSGVHIDQRDLPIKTKGSGTLKSFDRSGKALGLCPLEHTDVVANVSGHVAKVSVIQKFRNNNSRTVEAVYTFPLPNKAAVDEMHMKIGNRKIAGLIKKREEAKRIYRRAKRAGHAAALLDQERPNIFTQAVANIPPGEEVEIEIKYVDFLPFENGEYTFAFPMVVGQRFIPGTATTHRGTGWSSDTNRVPDASRITPPSVRQNKRAGHDISLKVNINAGVPISAIDSKLHKVTRVDRSKTSTNISLSSSDSIPNRDFVLKWKVGSGNVETGFLTHKVGRMGCFAVSVVPPARPTAVQINPREIVFIIDRSGSQRGLPLQKAKETVLYSLDKLNDNDTFQVITFSNTSETLFTRPVKASYNSLSTAKKFVSQITADGGTKMREAILKAASSPAPQNRLRIFALMTDGFIGNESEVIGLVKRTRRRARWFTFGTGNSVNRHLIDGIAKAGGGEADIVLLNRPGNEVAKSFNDKIANPVLTDVKVSISGVSVSNVLPTFFNDVWSQRPLYITGQYTGGGKGVLTLSGIKNGAKYSRNIVLNFPTSNRQNMVLPSVWARGKVAELMDELNLSKPGRSRSIELKDQVEDLGLNYSLLTPFTSFVAVDENGKRYRPSNKTAVVPTESPDGVIQKHALSYTTKRSPISGKLVVPRKRILRESAYHNKYYRPAHRSIGNSNFKRSVSANVFNSSSRSYSNHRNGARFCYEPNIWRKRKPKNPVRIYGHQVKSGSIPKSNFELIKNSGFLAKPIPKVAPKLVSPQRLTTQSEEEAEAKISKVLMRTLDSLNDTEMKESVVVKVTFKGDQEVLCSQLIRLGVKVKEKSPAYLILEMPYRTILKMASFEQVLSVIEHKP